MPARCPLCLRSHGPAPGDVGGTMYSDAVLAAAVKERKMIHKLCKEAFGGAVRAKYEEAYREEPRSEVCQQ